MRLRSSTTGLDLRRDSPIKRYLILAETYHKLISQDCLDLSAVFADDLISQQLHVEARPSTDERIVENEV